MIQAKQIIKLSEGDGDRLQKIKDLVYKHGYRQAPSSLVWAHYNETCLGAKIEEISYSKKTIKELKNSTYILLDFDGMYKKVCYIVGDMNVSQLQPSKDHTTFDISCGNKNQFFPARVNFSFKMEKQQTGSRLVSSVYVNLESLENLNPKNFDSFWKDFSTHFPFMINRVADEINHLVRFNK